MSVYYIPPPLRLQKYNTEETLSKYWINVVQGKPNAHSLNNQKLKSFKTVQIDSWFNYETMKQHPYSYLTVTVQEHHLSVQQKK